MRGREAGQMSPGNRPGDWPACLQPRPMPGALRRLVAPSAAAREIQICGGYSPVARVGCCWPASSSHG